MIAKDALKAFLSRELDSLTWMKKLPRETLERELRSFKVRPKFKGDDPWTHQLVCFLIGCSYPEFLFLLDMGLGKTRILLDLMTQRQREGRFKRAIVTVPRLVNLGSWEDAIREYSDFEPNIISGSVEEKWEMLSHPKGDVTVIDYSGLQHALSSRRTGSKMSKKGQRAGKNFEYGRDDAKIREVSSLYSFFGMDESHKSKNKDALRFKLLDRLTANMPDRYATTGTLFGRNPEDIWAQFYLVDRGETFGNTLGMFRAAFFAEEENYWKGTEYRFNKGMTRDLYRFLHNRSIRYSEDECLDLPRRRQVTIPIQFTVEQREHYLRAVDGLIQAKGQLKELDANYIRMRQICAGFLEWREDDEKCRVIFRDNLKLDALERLVAESGDSKLVVSHEYTLSGQMITDRLIEMGVGFEWLYGKSKDPINAVRRFLSDPAKRVFVMNSESGGTGTDGLQKQARYLVFYESPTSPITRQQVLKRVHRPGQEREPVIYDLVITKSVDERILALIKQGQDLHSAVVDGRADPKSFSLLR